jgi:Alr-MurF fusion protein
VDAVSIADLADIVGGGLTGWTPQADLVRHVTIHSQHIMQGSVFFALPGARTEGHKFAHDALANGAVGVVLAEDQSQAHDYGGPVIQVPDPLESLQRLAKWWRSQLSATVVAVVGSSGKTVTKDALVQILGADRRVFGTPGSFNSKVGVPLALLDCPADCDVAILEAAATEPGEMSLLQDVIHPDHVVFTNLGTRHASNFPGTEAHVRELLSITKGNADGWLVIGDPQPVVRGVAAGVAARRYHRGESTVIPAFTILESNPRSTLARVSFPGAADGHIVIQTPFEEILMDIEVALAASWLLGVEPATALQALNDYVPTKTRMEVWQSPEGWTVVRDVATTDAVTLGTALQVSRRLARRSSRFSVVLSDPLESCKTESARALGRTLDSSKVDSLWALECAPHRAIGAVLTTMGSGVDVRYFASLEAMRPALRDNLGSDDIVLIESPRERSLADVTSTLIEPLAPTRLYIDRAALESNVIAFRRLIGPQVQLLAMVKGLAYGTNAIHVSRSLQAAGVDQLGVATVDEGVALRRAEVSLPILVTLATSTEMDKVIRNDLTPQVYTPSMLDSVILHARMSARRQPLKIHLEVETGMHRTGFQPADAIKALERLRGEPSVSLAGLMTHFACADLPGEDDFTLQQMSRFTEVTRAAEELGFKDFIRHAANTAGAIRFPAARLDMVRVGLGLYGVYPSPETVHQINLTPVVALVSQIVEIQDLTEGDRIGYGGTYRVPAGGRRVAVVAAGYHDCVPRSLSNFGYVSVDGRKCRILGIVSMDSMVVDVSDCPGAAVGSDVLIYGRHGGASVPIEEVAAAMDTIPYELLSRVQPRVLRVLTQH